MRFAPGPVLCLVSTAFLAWPGGHARAQAAPPSAEKLGRVDFTVSCRPDAQAAFTRGMALYHSYFFPEARKSFSQAAAADPSCGMAHWGLAVVTMDNPFQWPLSGKALAEGLQHIERAKAAGLPTQRERDYVAAAEVFYRDADRVPARTRQLGYELALDKLARDGAGDVEARILHAMVLSANFDPNDKTYGNQHRAADVLEPLYVKHPDHPGVAHYLIHTYDYPPLAKRGLAAAYRYRDVAPSAPHALHMPSHIFTRLGLWEDSIASNRATLGTTSDARSRLHSLDYIAYAHLQLGQFEQARRVADEVAGMKRLPDQNFTAAYALAAVPARLAIERQRWTDAMNVELSPGEFDFGWASFPHAEAINAYARGLGAARAGRPDLARIQAARLATLRGAMLDAKLFYWVEQAEIQMLALDAWTGFAERRTADALATMRRAADREDATEKNVVTPGPIKPAREMLGEMLLQAGEPIEALAAFERVLKNEPNRFLASLGAARAADAIPQPERAQAHYRAAAALWRTGDQRPPELEPFRTSGADAGRATPR
jgi:tetratricopeptide (TPR) repeat protein